MVQSLTSSLEITTRKQTQRKEIDGINLPMVEGSMEIPSNEDRIEKEKEEQEGREREREEGKRRGQQGTNGIVSIECIDQSDPPIQSRTRGIFRLSAGRGVIKVEFPRREQDRVDIENGV